MDADKYHAVVEFAKDKSCYVIPWKWVSSSMTTCRWPNKNVAVHLRNGTGPLEGWEKMAITVKYRTDSEEKAQAKYDQLVEGENSTLESDDDGGKRRTRRLPAWLRGSEFHLDHPLANSQKKGETSKGALTVVEKSSTVEEKSSTVAEKSSTDPPPQYFISVEEQLRREKEAMAVPNYLDKGPQLNEGSDSDAENALDKLSPSSQVSSRHSKRGQSDDDSDDDPRKKTKRKKGMTSCRPVTPPPRSPEMPDGQTMSAFEKAIVGQMSKLKSKINRKFDEIRRDSRRVADPVPPPPTGFPHLPIDTWEDLVAFNNMVKDDATIKTHLQSVLERKQGNTEKDSVEAMLKALMTLKLRSKCNFEGRSGRKGKEGINKGARDIVVMINETTYGFFKPKPELQVTAAAELTMKNFLKHSVKPYKNQLALEAGTQ